MEVEITDQTSYKLLHTEALKPNFRQPVTTILTTAEYFITYDGRKDKISLYSLFCYLVF
jgi:hypothetical protein